MPKDQIMETLEARKKWRLAEQPDQVPQNKKRRIDVVEKNVEAGFERGTPREVNVNNDKPRCNELLSGPQEL